MMIAVMRAVTSRWLIAACAVLLVVMSGTLLLAVFLRPGVHQFTLIDGTRLQFLGGTLGTNHMNPATPTLIRLVAKWPAIASIVIPRIPSEDGRRPHRVVRAPAGSPFAVLWFYSQDDSSCNRRLIIRCSDSAGEQIGSVYSLNFRSTTNAAPVTLFGLDQKECSRICIIEIFDLDTTLKLPSEPFTDLVLLSASFMGRFEVPGKLGE